MKITLTWMSLLMMISNEKMKTRNVATSLTNLSTCNASWPKTENQCSHNKFLISSGGYTAKKYINSLTIPVNNIDTIPDRPRPSASMYLQRMKLWIKSHHKSKKEREDQKRNRKMFSYEKYGNRTKRQHSKFCRLKWGQDK